MHFIILILTVIHTSGFLFYCYGDHRALHSFPTRRSSDLNEVASQIDRARHAERDREDPISRSRSADRKSTRLNSSHLVISYAVFCLKKKKVITKKMYKHLKNIMKHIKERVINNS